MISDEEKKDLKRLAQEYNVDFDELVSAYKKTSEEADKMDKEEEKQKSIDDVFKELETKKGKDSSLDKAIKELTQRINKLRESEEDEEKIDDQLEILRQTRLMREEGLVPESDEKEES